MEFGEEEEECEGVEMEGLIFIVIFFLFFFPLKVFFF